MIDKRKEIPAWAFINMQIIQDANSSGMLLPSIRRVEEGYQLPPNSLVVINSAYLLSLLYCLIVVPKELWLRDKHHPFFARINPDDLLGLFVIKQKSPDFDSEPVYNFLRHLRNAISHVRFSIGEDEVFTFWDQRYESSLRHFEASASRRSMEIFLSTVGSLLANLRVEG
jgi:hypothetical protein